jgi:limonene-1,2-epoxide hydrolase
MGYPERVEGGHHIPGLAMVLGDEVMQERVDRFKIRGTWIEVSCNAIWRIRDARIASWKDYYDLDTYVRQLAAVGVRVDLTEWV